jgi:hypothetical protein
LSIISEQANFRVDKAFLLDLEMNFLYSSFLFPFSRISRDWNLESYSWLHWSISLDYTQRKFEHNITTSSWQAFNYGYFGDRHFIVVRIIQQFA